MNLHVPGRDHHPRPPRMTRAAGAILALTALLLVVAVGCDDEISKEFRAASADLVEAGVQSIFEGLITGVFTVADPNADSSDTAGDTTGGATDTTGGTTGG